MEANEYNTLIIAGIIEVGFLLTPLIFGFLDFISGVRKAKSRGETITSTGWQRTTKKIAGYYNLLIAVAFVDAMQISCIWFLDTFYQYGIPMFPFLTLLVSIFVAAIEIKSIREKAEDKVKKQMTEVANMLVDMIKSKGSPEDAIKRLTEYMNSGKQEH